MKLNLLQKITLRPRSHSVTLAASLLCAICCAVAARADDQRAPEVPAAITVPAGQKVHFHAYAEGVQIYTWNGASWGASIPEAILYDADGNVVGIHYGGPTWESNSGSKVMAAVVPPRATVDPASIPWLLLKATIAEGPGILARTSYIHRVNTAGGNAPATPGEFPGQVVRVPYTAEYFFYRETNH